ncbi:MAG: hypothetical protein JSV88_05410 [Candidatus Aminicenantes bacterium]|nr:MAG: hypothetical protein JSV88_05410 [Candidatus Aminicenantes bacterium]
MIHLRTTIPDFLKNSRMLIFGVKEDDFIKQRILEYNFDETRITEAAAAFEEAEKTESNKTLEYGEQLEAKARFDKLMEESEYIFKKHADFIKLALRDDIEKQNLLFITGQPRSQKLIDWFKYVLEFYNRVLGDDDVVGRAAKYGITKEKLEQGRQTITTAQDAKTKHEKEMGEAQDATDQRDTAFEILLYIVEELELICKYALEDRPQLLEKLGIEVLSPGYKKKSKSKKEEETEEPVS